MVEVYFKLVINKKRTCDETNTIVKQVPAALADDVKKLLTQRGYDFNGNKIN